MTHLLASNASVKFISQVLDELLFDPGQPVIIDSYHQYSVLVPAKDLGAFRIDRHTLHSGQL
jgi:hypothetical protein